jgi:outer membrane biosynthesis protein TonB
MRLMSFASTLLLMAGGTTSGADQPHDGGLSKVAVAGVVKAHMQNVKKCYEDELPKHPTLSGAVVLAWTVELDGRVVGTRVAKSSINNSGLETCLVDEVAQWIFPKAPQKTYVNEFPFVFKSGGPTAPRGDGGSSSLSNPALNPTGLRPAG